MGKMEWIILAIMVFFTFYGAIIKIRNTKKEYKREGKDRYLNKLKSRVLFPLYYFHGYECRICGKMYLSSHKSFICCPGPHNADWFASHPEETYLTDPNTLPPEIRFRSSINPDVYLIDCPRCGGSGRSEFGVRCDLCDGRGKIFRGSL